MHVLLFWDGLKLKSWLRLGFYILSCCIIISINNCLQLNTPHVAAAASPRFELVEEKGQLEQIEQLRRRLMPCDVMIDVGHGGIDGGTSAGELLEKDLNLAIGRKLYATLQARGYGVSITRLHDYALSDDSPFSSIRSRHLRDLKQRVYIAKVVKPKLFISIHTNYSSISSIRGPLVIHQNTAESYLFAQLLQESLNETAQINKKSYPSRRYFLLNGVKTPALITEVGYISHYAERKKLVDDAYQDKLVNAIAQAIEQYFIIYYPAKINEQGGQ